MVVSLAATLERSVSSTPDLRLSTSILLTVLLSTSIVLFVSVWLPANVDTVPSMAKVTPLPEAEAVRPVPPNNDKVSESRSIAIVLEPSVISRSCAVTVVST